MHALRRKVSEKVLGRVWARVRGLLWIYSKKGSEKGFQKVFLEGGLQKVPRMPPRRVRRTLMVLEEGAKRKCTHEREEKPFKPHQFDCALLGA